MFNIVREVMWIYPFLKILELRSVHQCMPIIPLKNNLKSNRGSGSLHQTRMAGCC